MCGDNFDFVSFSLHRSFLRTHRVSVVCLIYRSRAEQHRHRLQSPNWDHATECQVFARCSLQTLPRPRQLQTRET